MLSSELFKTSLSGFNIYLLELNHLALDTYDCARFEKEYNYALNGGPSKELRQSLSIDLQRKYGAFFTGTELGNRLVHDINLFNDHQVFYDPCCGMGDLLLAAARKLPLCKTITLTLQNWGKKLSGTDLHSEFINGTKARLVILARKRHKIDILVNFDWNNCFPNIRVADGLQAQKAFSKASIILLNPPFGRVMAPANCKWGMGQISEAANFLINTLESSNNGTTINAILPDVLRSGTNYQRWRNKVNDLAVIHKIETYGLFDRSTNVHVFLLKLIKNENLKVRSFNKWPDFAKDNNITIGDLFDVNVGRVVPQRDKKIGTDLIYIHPRSIPPWSIISEFSENLKHDLKPFIPPFVVIRRTSRPGDTYRAIASIIIGRKPVAVENHFIVCKPKDNKFTTCRKLMNELKKEHTNQFLNQRIRCRHLTISSVKMIPISSI
jgi:hypothetical protein